MLLPVTSFPQVSSGKPQRWQLRGTFGGRTNSSSLATEFIFSALNPQLGCFQNCSVGNSISQRSFFINKKSVCRKTFSAFRSERILFGDVRGY